MKNSLFRLSRFALAALLPVLLVSAARPSIPTPQAAYIVQAASLAQATAAVNAAGARVQRPLPLIDGVVALLDDQTLARLRSTPGLALHPDSKVQLAKGKPGKETDTAGYLLYPAAATQALALHGRSAQGPKTACMPSVGQPGNGGSAWRVTVDGSAQEGRPLRGWGVTVAVIDSGLLAMRSPNQWDDKDAATGTLVAGNNGRCLVYRDFLPAIKAGNPNDNFYNSIKAANSTDQNGHGTHVLSTIGDNWATTLVQGGAASPVGVAPDVNLVVARALDSQGGGTYSDVIAAIEWIISQRATFNIRVLNLSLYAPVNGPYWADPLNQAVMKAWQAGITVVAAAGNEGPTAATITVPGNVPYVITAGAVKSGRYSASGSDELASYSSRGPTESAFVKPDLVVPATRTIAPMPEKATLAQEVADGRLEGKHNVDYGIGQPANQAAYYQLSGTSMAAAEISGIAALIIQANPGLSNNQVKARLLATARPAYDAASGLPAYSVWEQGAGLVDSVSAVLTTTTVAANQGMDIALDLDTTQATQTHYWGYSTWDGQRFQLLDPATGTPLQLWDGGTKSWAGGTKSWAGGTKSWAGGTKSWAGGTKSWAGGTKSWAGSYGPLWAGSAPTWAASTASTPVNTASRAELLLNETQDQAPDDGTFRLNMATLLR